ncbi:hypothetical protein L2725_13940 [Shewanella corallii]|uniref:FLYWCH-type domain-containing protein n=2 Tax=Shewanella TaxID=22 RepID=A0ABT0N8V8_9GAMM|nr:MULTISPECIES: hypothetical protein [Shewanella]MCL1039171.1 hypothetical protein [Shewanella submarina]MCL2914864.1 hypothetical protein [Shewanella corallii]
MANGAVIDTVYAGGAYRVEKRSGKDRRVKTCNWQGYERRAPCCRRSQSFATKHIDETV